MKKGTHSNPPSLILSAHIHPTVSIQANIEYNIIERNKEESLRTTDRLFLNNSIRSDQRNRKTREIGLFSNDTRSEM